MYRYIVLGLLLFINSLHMYSASDEKKPNIIIVLTDDQGYGDVSAHGSPDVSTPHMDRLKRESVSLEDFHVSPTCAPTRSAIMSGRAPFKSGVTHTILERERMALGITTLPEVLKRANYTTGIFGKWHLGDEKEYQPESRGFDEVFIHGGGGIGQNYIGSCADVPKNRYQDPVIKHNDKFVKTEGFCTDVLFLQALAWIKEKHKQEQPFFAYISTNAAHKPFVAPDSYRKKFADKKYPKDGQGYFGMIENIDDNLGLLMKKLDEWKLSEHTILIFMSDNGRAATPTNHKGEMYNAGMKGMKKSSHRGGTRVPFFMRWPEEIKAGSQVNSLFSHYDILPTLAEVANITIDDIALLDGESFLPYVKGEKSKANEKYRFVHMGRWGGMPSKYIGYTGNKHKFQGDERSSDPNTSKYRSYAVRTQQYRFVDNSELYDIRKDPSEEHNIIDKQPAIAAEMKKAYETWWDSILPYMVNEDETIVKEKPFVVLYEKQLKSGGIPKWKKPNL